MSYNVAGESAGDEIAPLRPIQRRSTLPARVSVSPPSAMRQPILMKSPLTTASIQKSSARGRNKVVVLDETLPQTQGQPVIINNYVGADSGDSEGERSRTRSRRQQRRYNNVELYEHDEDDSDSRAHRRHRSGRASSPSLVSFSTSEDEYSDDVYNFTPSYASVSSESLKDRAPSADSSTPFLATIGASPPRTAKTMYIYKSQYTGDAFHEGNHASKLTLLHDPRHPQQALFRWIHIKQPVMSFDAFWDEIAGISNLTSSEKNGIKRLLQGVKSRSIRRVVTAHGSHRVMQTNGFPMRRLQSGDTETPTSRPKAVYWVNLPFFELKGYSSEKYSSELFPAQTLMQADYSQHLKARDMQQAVRQIKEGSGEQCFHISQLWGIIVDNSLLVTCSTMSDDKLGKTSIETKSVPPKEKNGESDELRILVEYRESTLWAIPLRECLTWFEFTTHFWEFWPDNLHFYRHRKLLSSNDWPDIVESVQQGTKRVLLEAITKPLPILPTRGVLVPIVEPKASAKQPDFDGVSTNRTDEAAGGLTASTPSGSTADELPQESEGFSVFAWIKTSPEFSRTMTIRAELERVDRFVRKKTRRNDQRAYSECPEATPDEVRAELERLAVEKNLLELDEESKLQRELRDRIDIFNSAVIIFTFFLPLQFVGPSIGKFWGSLKLLLDDDFMLTEPRIHCDQRPWPEDNNEAQSLNWTKRQRVANSNLYIARKDLRGIARQVLFFQRVMSHAPDPNKAGIEIPVQLLQAYIYFVLALIRASVDTNPDWSYMRTVSSLLQTGIREILKSFSPASLLTYSSILPTEVLSLMSLGLLNDLTGPYPDIYTVYSEWIKTLENEIETKPALSHQEKIRWLLVEINVIIETLEKQKSIFDDIIRGRTSSYRAVVPEQYYDLRRPLHIQYNNAPDRTLTRARSRERYRETKNSGRAPVHYAERSRWHTHAQAYDGEGSVSSADRYGYDDLDSGFQLQALDPGGYRLLLARDCRSIVDQRLAEFKQFKGRAHALQQANIHMAETRKDYHDQAIYAFTIVTVIFLPLSAISSIFGMNTSDIRELEQGQWLYWATAVPVTAGVILIGLWWMGELGNTALWLLNLRQRQSAPAMRHEWPTGAGPPPPPPAYLPPQPRPPPPPTGYVTL